AVPAVAEAGHHMLDGRFVLGGARTTRIVRRSARQADRQRRSEKYDYDCQDLLHSCVHGICLQIVRLSRTAQFGVIVRLQGREVISLRAPEARQYLRPGGNPMSFTRRAASVFVFVIAAILVSASATRAQENP